MRGGRGVGDDSGRVAGENELDEHAEGHAEGVAVGHGEGGVDRAAAGAAESRPWRVRMVRLHGCGCVEEEERTR
jgi:hypothetical protein